MARSDPNAVLRRLPLVVGALGGSLLLLNRLNAPLLTDSQARSDALGILLSALLILTGLLWQQVQPRLPESVVLEGTEGFELTETLPESVRLELAWTSRTLLTNTVTRSVVVWYDEQTLLRRGVLGPTASVKPGPILKRALETQKPIYLVALKVYPGRIEFNYLPPNTQGVIVQPLGPRGALILGANAPRSYTRQDEAWVAAIAEKLTVALELVETEAEGTVSEPGSLPA
ncbi:cofactor assembly of complex C subunit B [Leptolyngbya sp. FACHB-261]|uniref:cofactor assembly of complex C subunit B n=1 Tax=Leptolyngbya sp. FACHB-261 TaxID=2692806 RepID=UPI001682E288|nr:cofactor assembly of complex C subunit B [Leptolyngbya sp. FACHB-261]MBD2101319.1 cofactor assembly of complex C subunit B [Leptolyngbya sp. FACHB-261]